VHLSEFIIQALVDTLGAALLSDVVLGGYLIKWRCFGLAIQGNNPLALVAKTCSCCSLPNDVCEFGILSILLGICLGKWSGRGVVIQGLATVPSVSGFLGFGFTLHSFDLLSCACHFVNIHTAI
jgi:hypothetical protein